MQWYRAFTDKIADSTRQNSTLYITLITVLLSVNHYLQTFLGREYVRLMNSLTAFVTAQELQSKYKFVTNYTVHVTLEIA